MLTDRIAVITGASAGIGEAIARDFVAQNAVCVLNARRKDRLAAFVRELGVEDAVGVAGDCCDERVIDSMIAAAASDTLGPKGRGADLVVINAGRGLGGSPLTSDPAQWDEMIRTNYIGAARLIRAASKSMLAEMERELGARAAQPGAHLLSRPRDIVVIGSTVGRHISPFSSMYGSTKFAVHALGEAAGAVVEVVHAKAHVRGHGFFVLVNESKKCPGKELFIGRKATFDTEGKKSEHALIDGAVAQAALKIRPGNTKEPHAQRE